MLLEADESVETTISPRVNSANRKGARWLWALGGIALVTIALAPFHDAVSSTTVALTYLLVILFVAAFAGRNPALLASVIGTLCFNFFFLPPVHFDDFRSA